MRNQRCGHLPRGVFIGVILVGLTISIAGNGAEMKAGVARVDITPPAGVQMWGYSNSSIATGTLDPLYARVLVLEVGGQRLAYVDLDLGRTFEPKALEELRKTVKQSSGIDDLIVQAIHTHAGPSIRDEYPSGHRPAWEQTALTKIERAIQRAQESAVPARLGVGYGVAYIGYNRRRVNPDGTVTMIWNNPAEVPTAPVDPTVAVLRIDGMDGEPLAVLVNYACHPVTFGPDNTLYSADFPGVMCKVVRQAFGGKPVCFYLQGAAGDINVYHASIPVKDGAALLRTQAGDRLGEVAARVAKRIKTEIDPDPSLEFAEDNLPFRLRWNPQAFKQAMLSFGSEYLPDFHKVMQPPVTTVLIDRKVAMMGMPGEPFVQFQKDWRTHCPVQSCFFLGYANGYFGYFPTIKAASEGGYGAVNATTWVQVGAGDRMEHHALIKVYQMLGRLSKAPNDDWKSEELKK